MLLAIGEEQFEFYKAEIHLLETGLQNVFSRFDKKTLGELIQQTRYESLKTQCEKQYADLLDMPAGQAIYSMKRNGNPFYLHFLNNYGDLTYSRFNVKGNETILNKAGVYTILVNNELVFTGVCAKSFKIRFNQHIGNISPKSCFKDGTATHCHVNANITKVITHSKIFIQMCPLTSKSDMKKVKNYLINRFEPIWNIRFTSELTSTIVSN